MCITDSSCTVVCLNMVHAVTKSWNKWSIDDHRVAVTIVSHCVGKCRADARCSQALTVYCLYMFLVGYVSTVTQREHVHPPPLPRSRILVAEVRHAPDQRTRRQDIY